LEFSRDIVIMSIVRRGNSQNWYIQFRLSGRTIIKSARTTNRRAAEQMEARLRSEIHANTFLGHKPRISLSDALNRYGRRKAHTPNHANILGHINAITSSVAGSTFLDSLGAIHCEQFMDARLANRVAPQTLKHGFNVLKGTIDLAKADGYKVPDLQLPSVKISSGRLRYLTTHEEALLLKELDPKRNGPGLHRSHNHEPELRAELQDLFDLVVILLDTGARCGEIRQLEWRQVDLEHSVIHLWRSKVANEGLLYMTDRVRRILFRRNEQRASKYVFTNKAGNGRGHSYAAWRKAFNRAGLHDCTIHTLRHTHATRLIQNGMTVYEVQTVLGHSDPKTTMRYAHLEQATVTAKARDVIDRLNRPIDDPRSIPPPLAEA
jgi:integrase